MKVVAMGGGTGLSILLQGLKKYARDEWAGGELRLSSDTPLAELTAVVTVTDDGGSSGRLRRDFQVLPPGDIRNCMVALSEDEALLSRLFQYRFPAGRGLKGHSFGNLFLTALTAVTGDFQDAVKVSSEVLAIRGRIFPSTNASVTLEARMEDGRLVRGETQITRSRSRIQRLRLAPARCRPLPQTLQAMEEADAITLGPGSLFTSLLPNLLVPGVARSLARSRAARIFICNLMTQPGETSGYSAAAHLRAVYEHCGRKLFDYALLNDAAASARSRRRYLAQHSRQVENDAAALERLGVRVITRDLLLESKGGPAIAGKVRHDSGRLAEAVLEIATHHQSSLSRPGEKKARVSGNRPARLPLPVGRVS